MTHLELVAVVKGAGDLATGVAFRLFKYGIKVIMTEIRQPLAVRRTVSFAEAVYSGSVTVEGVTARLADTVPHALDLLEKGIIPVLVDPEAAVVKIVRPQVLVDARMLKRSPGASIEEAPLVVGLGPGFTAGLDVHAVVETCRGPHLGRVIYSGSAIPDTGIPGPVGGYTRERLLRAPVGGVVLPLCFIGDRVKKGEVVALVGKTQVTAEIPGVIRGMIKEGTRVPKGAKIGDIDPRADASCHSISDKALAVGGGVLEAFRRVRGTVPLTHS